MLEKLYRDYNSYLRELFGCRVQKITIDAGLTCPNRDGTLARGGCIYCNDKGSGTGAYARASITDQVRFAKERLARKYNARKFLAYFQSYSNTYAPLEKLAPLYEQALADPDIVGLSIGTRPDCVPDDVLDHLESISRTRLVWMEYGLQSSNDKTLRLINRGHESAAFSDALRRTRARHIPVCAHVILGLPGEDLEDMLATARFLADSKVEALKIHLLYVVKQTRLHELYLSGEYRCLSREEYARAAGQFLALIPPEVIIQRITGDPHRQELAAPGWALEKQKNLEAVQAYMREKELYQGKHYRASDQKRRSFTGMARHRSEESKPCGPAGPGDSAGAR
ncbi:MAG: TIGR01212 family radical SAM protein [Syntrophobacteraceae bacterium]